MLKRWYMTNKQSLYVVVFTMLFAGILAKLRAAMDRQVPLGYQDENGFHLGAEPEGKTDWPWTV